MGKIPQGSRRKKKTILVIDEEEMKFGSHQSKLDEILVGHARSSKVKSCARVPAAITRCLSKEFSLLLEHTEFDIMKRGSCIV